MLHSVLAVKDKKTGFYETVFTAKHPSEAARDWVTVKQNKQSRYGMYPEDFDLYEIAQFNDQTCEFINLQAPVHINEKTI